MFVVTMGGGDKRRIQKRAPSKPRARRSLPAAVTRDRNAELAALSPDDILRVNLRVPDFVDMLRSTAKRMQRLVRQLAQLPAFRPELLEDLVEYGTLLSRAHDAYQMPAGSSGSAEWEEAKQLRVQLLEDLAPLQRRGLMRMRVPLSASQVASFENVSRDLAVLAQAFRRAWPEIGRNTCVTLEELARARELSASLQERAMPTEADAARAAAAELRDRAFTLATRTYAELQRAVQYVFPDRANALMPSPYAPRRKAS